MKLWLVDCFENLETLGIEVTQPCHQHGGTENYKLTTIHRAFNTAAFELGRGVSALVRSTCTGTQIVLPMMYKPVIAQTNVTTFSHQSYDGAARCQSSEGICESSFCSLWPSLGSTPVSDIKMVDLVSSITFSEIIDFAFRPRVDMEATASRTVTAGQKGFLFHASRLLRRGV